MTKQKIVIIGAGLAGLNAARHAINFNCDVTVFEQTDKIGGTWVLSDEIGKDKYGLKIHSSMYKGLHTNLPKEVMGFPDFPFPESERSFIPANEVLKYLNDYADKFELRKLIKFEHLIIRVHPIADGKWEVTVKNLPLDKCETLIFDAVFVCNGHYSEPVLPTLEGSDVFEGKQLHAHDFRDSADFTNEKVLIIGCGPSGLDMTIELSKVADKVTLSHHSDKPITTKFNPNVDQKPDVARLTKNGAIFTDDSEAEYTVVLYCTGYKYNFSFLTKECQISCEDNYVRHIYKHCININHPTMVFIGIPYYGCPAQMCDLQNRFCLTFVTGRKPMPTRETMLAETEKDMQKQWDRGLKTHQAHVIGTIQFEHFSELARLADIEPIKPVISKLYLTIAESFSNNFMNFRQNNYRIIDDENFIQI